MSKRGFVSRATSVTVAMGVSLFSLAGTAFATTPSTFSFRIVPPRVVSGIVEVSTPGELIYIDKHQTAPIRPGSSKTYLSATINLMNTINMSGYKGWVPFGNINHPFQGIFNGYANSINNLVIDDSVDEYVGFFGVIGDSGWVQGLRVDATVTAHALAGATLSKLDPDPSSLWMVGTYAGILAGKSSGGISGVWTTGSVSHANFEGGIVGRLEGTSKSNAQLTYTFSTATVMGGPGWSTTPLGYNNDAGGLIGLFDEISLTPNEVWIRNDYAAGTVGVSPGYANVYPFGGIIGVIESSVGFNYQMKAVAYDKSRTTATLAVGDGNATAQQGSTAVTTQKLQSSSVLGTMQYNSSNWIFSPLYNHGFPYFLQWAPGVVQNLQVAHSSATSATLTWNAPGTANNPRATGYNIYEAGKSAPVAMNVKTTRYQITGLSPGQKYQFFVAATDGYAESRHGNPVSVTTPLSGNAYLKRLDINGSPVANFQSNQLTYSVTEAPSTNRVTVTPTTSDTHAAVKVGTQALSSGQQSQPIPLQLGKNQISIVVKAEDGTTHTYVLNLTRSLPVPTNLHHQKLTTTGWTETWAPVSGSVGYNVYVDHAKVNQKPITGTSLTLSGYQPNTVHSVQVAAVFNGVNGRNGIEGGQSSADQVNTKGTLSGQMPEVPYAGTLPLMGLTILGGVIFYRRRRRSPQ